MMRGRRIPSQTAQALTLAVLVAACAKDPVTQPNPQGPTIQASTSDDDDEPYQDPSILYASTEVSMYGSEFGGAPGSAVLAYTRYIGNWASHDIDISTTLDDGEPFPSRHFSEVAETWWQPIIVKEFPSHVFEELPGTCGANVQANTQHDVTWNYPVPTSWANRMVNGMFQHDFGTSYGSAYSGACAPCGPPPPPPPNDQSAPVQPSLTECTPQGGGDPGGGGGSGYAVTVTTCWGYHVYVDGVYQYSVVEDCEEHTYWVNME